MKAGKEGKRTRHDMAGLLIGLGLTIAVVLNVAFRADWYESFELRFLDMRFWVREALKPIRHTSRLVHIDIDDQSVDALGRWPWNRKTHATFVSALSALGAQSIVFDVEFPDPVEAVYDPTELPARLRDFVETQKAIMDDPLQAWETRARALFAGAKSTLMPEVEKARVNDDEVFAAAVRRAGNVWLPVSFAAEEGWGGGDVVHTVQKLLAEDLLPGAPAIAQRLGVAIADLPPKLSEMKQKMAYDRALQMLRTNPHATDQAIWHSLCPNTTETIDSSVPDAKCVRDACRMARSVFAMEPKIALTLKGHLQEHDAIRFTTAPIPELALASRGGGFVTIEADKRDGKIRQLKLLWSADGFWYPHHMLRAVMDLYHVPLDGLEIREGPTLVLHPPKGDPVEIPMDDTGRTIVNWAGGEWVRYLGTHLPYATVMEFPRRLLEAGRLLQEQLGHVDTPVDTSGWDEAAAAISPGEALGTTATGLTSSEGLARVKKIEQTMTEALEATLQKVDQELSNKEQPLPPTARARYTRTRDEISSALAQARRAITEADDLELRIRSIVAGKMCIIGSTQWGGTDFKPTPLHEKIPGVALHSNLFNMIETRSFVARAKILTNALVTLFIGLLVTLVAIRSGPVRAGILSMAILLAYVLTGFWAFMWHGSWIDLLGPILAAGTCYTSIGTFKEWIERKERKKVEGLWGQYVSPTVVELLLKNPDLQRIFAERRVVTMLFSDVAGFTRESERLGAEVVRDLINEYLEEMSAPVVKYDGYLNKYEGDAIMAFWGAPIAQPDQAVRSCWAALDMMETLRRIQKGFLAKGLPPMHTRIGINTGLVLVGNFGSKMKFDYTAIGDHVNLASRLEGANKAFKTGVLIAEATYLAAKEFVEARRLGRIRVVGRETAVGIYELLARKGELAAEVADAREVFEQGLAAFEKRQWEAAHGCFRRVQEKLPNDGPSRVYLDAISTLASVVLPPEWDGVITLESK